VYTITGTATVTSNSGTGGTGQTAIVSLTVIVTGDASPPNGVVALALNKAVKIVGAQNSNGDLVDVYRGTAAGQEASTPVNASPVSLPYVDTGLTNGTAYYYKLNSVHNGTQGGTASAEVSATPEAYGQYW
jgi:hypothetical protein